MGTTEHRSKEHKTRRRFEGRRHARQLNFACFQNRPFLRSERACLWFCDSLRAALSQHDTDLWAFCVMPTHVHLLLCPQSLEWRASAFLTSLKLSVSRKAVIWMTANAPHRLYLMQDESSNGRVQHRFWQRGGGFDRNLWSDGAIWKMIDYIHMNPVEAGLCRRPEEWRWSSAGEFARTGESPVQVELRDLPPQP